MHNLFILTFCSINNFPIIYVKVFSEYMHNNISMFCHVCSDRICIAQGTRHQADFIEGGAQCTVASYVFICLETSAKLNNKSAEDLDDIVQNGTDIYQNHRRNRLIDSLTSPTSSKSAESFLLINELPDAVVINGCSYTMKMFTNVYSGLIGTTESDISALIFSLTDAVNEAFAFTRSCFLTLGNASCAYTSAIVKNDRNYMCFDSHSRNREGMFVNVNGKSVLLEVGSVAALISYINDLATSLFTCTKTVPYELTPVMCSEGPIGLQENAVIPSCFFPEQPSTNPTMESCSMTNQTSAE
jgi:hypothetical protein